LNLYSFELQIYLKKLNKEMLIDFLE
jgi:hypothetical protein